jgi:hypothetical protein
MMGYALVAITGNLTNSEGYFTQTMVEEQVIG